MIKLRKIALKNIGPHKDLTVPLDAPMTVLVGPTGAGKSCIMDAITWCLTGISPRPMTPGGSPGEALLILEADGKEISIGIRERANGRIGLVNGNTCSLAEHAETVLRLTGQAGNKAALKWMAALMQPGAFLSADPATRQAMISALARTAGKTVGETMEEWAKSTGSKAPSLGPETKAKEASPDVFKDLHSRAYDRRREAKKELAAIPAENKPTTGDTTLSVQDARKLHLDAVSAVARAEAAIDSARRISDTSAEESELTQKLVELREDIASQVDNTDAIQNLDRQMQEALSEVAAIQKALDLALSPPATCPILGEPCQKIEVKRPTVDPDQIALDLENAKASVESIRDALEHATEGQEAREVDVKAAKALEARLEALSKAKSQTADLILAGKEAEKKLPNLKAASEHAEATLAAALATESQKGTASQNAAARAKLNTELSNLELVLAACAPDGAVCLLNNESAPWIAKLGEIIRNIVGWEVVEIGPAPAHLVSVTVDGETKSETVLSRGERVLLDASARLAFSSLGIGIALVDDLESPDPDKRGNVIGEAGKALRGGTLDSVVMATAISGAKIKVPAGGNVRMIYVGKNHDTMVLDPGEYQYVAGAGLEPVEQ